MAQKTTDHETIRKWAEAWDGRPARVKGTRDAKDAGLLRLDLGELARGGDREEFFDTFEESVLTFLYEEDLGNRFNNLVRR